MLCYFALELTSENIYSASNLHFDYWWFYFTAKNTTEEGTYKQTYTQKVELVAYDGAIITNGTISYANASQSPNGSITGTNSNQITATNVTQNLQVVKETNNAVTLNTQDRSYVKANDTYQVAVPIQVVADGTSDKTNQWIEVEIPAEFQASTVIFPVNSTVLQTSYKLYYETSGGSSGWLNSASDLYVASSGRYVGISLDGDYITRVKAFVGDYAKNGTYGSLSYIINGGAAFIIGKLAGTNDATITMRMYSCDPTVSGQEEGGVDNAESGSETGDITANVMSISYDNAKVSVGFTAPTTSMTAGETKTVNFQMINDYEYDSSKNTLGLQSPNFYFRNIDGVTIESVTAKDSNGNEITFNASEIVANTYDTSQGESVTKLTLTDLYAGIYFNNKTSTITVSVELTTSKIASGSYNWMNYIFWDVDGSTAYAKRYDGGRVVADVYDVNKNGLTSDKVWTPNSTEFTITAAKELLVDTYIMDGTTRKPAYDGTDTTAVSLTPSSTATYVVEMKNNMDMAVDEFTLYIPVPKTGIDFGSTFQNEAYMALTGEPTIDSVNADKYEIAYSIDAVDSNYQDATYSEAYLVDLAEVTMIRIMLDTSQEIEKAETAKITLSYKIADTETDVSKLETVNTFRPIYNINVSGTKVLLQGTLAGAKLINGVISGTVFMDNNGDGIFTAGTDDLFSSTTDSEVVKLYKLDSNSEYVYVESATVIEGKYEFPGLAKGDYKLDFNDLTNQTFTQSDSNLVNSEAGTTSGINPVYETSQTVNAGILNANPVIYNANGGSGNMASVMAKRGSTYTLTTNNTFTHANVNGVAVAFIGWSETEDSTIYSKNDNAPTTIAAVTVCSTTADPDGGITVYALWGYDTNGNGEADIAETKYRVSYNANGGSGNMESVSVLKGASYTIVSNEFSAPENYSFKEWNTSAGGSGTSYKSNEVITITGNITLYAQWEAISSSPSPSNDNNDGGDENTGPSTSTSASPSASTSPSTSASPSASASPSTSFSAEPSSSADATMESSTDSNDGSETTSESVDIPAEFESEEGILLGSSNANNESLTVIKSTEDENVYLILDENGTPLGTVTIPEGMNIGGIDILDNLVPLGSINNSIDDSVIVVPYSEINPKTGDDITGKVGILLVTAGALVLMFYNKKKQSA